MKNNPSSADILLEQAEQAKKRAAATVSAHRNLALSFLADAISGGAHKLVEANETDLAVARAAKQDEHILDSIKLDYIAIGTLAGRLRTLAAAPDPTDAKEEWQCENGMTVQRLCVPLGVIVALGLPNPRRTIETVAQIIKTGNALIFVRNPLTARTDAVFAQLFCDALACCALDGSTVQWADGGPEVTRALTGPHTCADAVLLGARSQKAHLSPGRRIPVICPGYGATHLYIDEGADTSAAALGIVESFYASCAPLSTVLVNWMVSDELLPVLEGKAMAAGIELCADARVRSTLHGIEEASEQDKTDARGRLLLLTVNSLSDALAHIRKYGAGLCEGIYTPSEENARLFCSLADAGTLTHNAPFSRANGFDAGLGADVSIGTDKLRGRGPLGLSILTTDKYVLKG